MGFLENFNVQNLFETASGGEYTAKAGTGWKAAAQAAPALLSTIQAAKAKRDYGIKVAEIETFMNNREDIKNPYANITNPFQNLAVATEGARFQAEQADIALANTLDSVRQAGGAGATALAQAALQSKRGVAISIEKQEAANQKLQAQGQLKVDSLKGQGELNRQLLQFRRDQDDLSELRNEADQLKAQQIVSRQQAAAGLGATFDALSSGIVPTQIGGTPTTSTYGTGTTMGPPTQEQFMQSEFNPDKPFGFMQQQIDNYRPTTDIYSGDDWNFQTGTYTPPDSYTLDMFQTPGANTSWEREGLTGMVEERERLQNAGLSIDNIQALIDSTRQTTGL